jgi:poly(A) polymerase
LRDAGFKAFFVGGAVRDMLLGHDPKDIDIVTSALPEDVLRLFPGSRPVGAAFGITMVPRSGMNYEVAVFREEREYMDGRHPEKIRYTDDSETDAKRRDFTVNGMFYDPGDGKIFDYNGGINDLKKGVIRTIGDPRRRFEEDALRILRAVRFAVRLNFQIARETDDAMRAMRHNLKKLSAERIKAEIDMMFSSSDPARAVEIMRGTGILDVILPEVVALSGVSQPEKFHPEGDVFEHTLLMLTHTRPPDPEMAWAVLLHDIGKPATMFLDSDGVEHFYGHEVVGAEIAERILKRFKFSLKSSRKIVHAVKNHMRFAHVDKMRKAKWKRLIAEPDFPFELELHRIDCMGCHGKLDNYVFLLDRVRELKEQPELPPPFLNGHDLIRTGMSPGPALGKALRELYDLQLEGRINSKAEAFSMLKKSYFGK